MVHLIYRLVDMFLFKKYFVLIAHNDSKESSNVFPAQYFPVIKSLSYNTSNLPIVRQVLRQKLERTTRQSKATITRCDLSPRFFCIGATLLCKFTSDKI